MTGTLRQQEAITNHKTSLVVSAGAGTGKTYVLVNKYLNLLETFGEGQTQGRDRVSVLNILALTFTEKAAAEMKERIRTELAKKEGDFWERSRLEFLIAPVQTFHSFCASVLREFAFEAGLEPSFKVLDNQEISRILALSFQELIQTPVDGEDKHALVRVLSLIGSHNLEKMIRYLYFHSEEADQFFSRLNSDQDYIISRWQEEIMSFRNAEVRKIRNEKFLSLITSMLAFADMDIPANDKAMIYFQNIKPHLEVMLNTCIADEFFDASDSFLKIKRRGGGSAKFWTEEILEEITETSNILSETLKVTNDIARMKFIPDDPFNGMTIRFLQNLMETFKRFCAIIEQKKSEAGGKDFTDLIRFTRHLFRTKRDLVASYYTNRYKYILIDEFQDTDPAQFEIVTTIIGEPSPDMQSLFIVGDPKQSIYLFRDADVTRFRDAQDLITGPCAGRNIPLDVCFRSSPAVVTFVNILFSRLFRTAENPWEFTYDAIKVSDEREDHTGSVSLMLIQKDTGITEHEAVADKIEELIRNRTEVYDEGPRDDRGNRTFNTRPATYKDIAILLERRTHLGLYIHSLAIRNIPYYVHKGSGFYKRQEILDLVSLLSVLSRPYDDVHLVGLLRSPYFGLSDLEILRISRIPGSSFIEKLKHSGLDYPESERVYTLLSRWHRRVGRIRLVPLIQSVLDESGVLAVYGGLIESDQILSNIDKLLTIVRNREDSGMYQLSDLVYDLHDALDREEEEGEAMIDDPDMNAVTLMTIHAAKGLEFPIVCVPEMAAKPNLTLDPILMDSNHDLMGVVLPDPEDNFESRKTPVYLLLKKGLDERLLAEKRRLLYVALTRSADHLIMSGEVGDTLPDGLHNTRLDWIISTVGITGNAIEEGMIHLQAEDGNEVLVQIYTPVPSDTDRESKDAPFSIPAELYDCSGRFTRRILNGSTPGGSPLMVTRVSEMLNLPVSQKDHNQEGGGSVFGSAVHEVLRGRDPELVICEFGIEDETLQSILYTVNEEFTSLPQLTNLLNIERERAFTVTIGGVALTGRIDLLARLSDGSWMVIDYKSEFVSAEELVMKKSYRFQVEIYRRAAEILSMKPVRGAIYSVYEKKLVEVDHLSDEEVFGILKRAESIQFSMKSSDISF
jgi:ATP-dependent helicase/nuclease subunit A